MLSLECAFTLELREYRLLGPGRTLKRGKAGFQEHELCVGLGTSGVEWRGLPIRAVCTKLFRNLTT